MDISLLRLHSFVTSRVMSRAFLLGSAGVIGFLAALMTWRISAPHGALTSVVDLDGNRVDQVIGSDDDITVFVFTQTECPISNRYAPYVSYLVDEFTPEGVRFCLVYPDPDDTADVVAEHVDEYGYQCDVLLDPRHELVKLAQVHVTPEATVFVGDRIAYRGRITQRDTEFGSRRLGLQGRDLEQAIRASLRGEAPEHAITDAIGCYIADLRT